MTLPPELNAPISIRTKAFEFVINTSTPLPLARHPNNQISREAQNNDYQDHCDE